MPRLRHASAASLLALLLGFAAASTGDTAPRLPAGVREISVDEAEKLIREQPDLAVIDVRTAPEFAEQGHLPRARLLDFFREDFDAALASLKLDPARPCLVYCAIGGRAQQAAERMVRLGYKQILLPRGSFKAWKKAGKPVEGAPAAGGS